MKIRIDKIYNILIFHGWHAVRITVDKGVYITILQHPSKKKLFYYNGVFGKSYRIYQERQVDITHKYYECRYNAEYDYDSANCTLTLDNFICINLE